MWKMEMKYSSNRMVEMAPRVRDFTSNAGMIVEEMFMRVICALADWLISPMPFVACVAMRSSLWQSHIMKI